MSDLGADMAPDIWNLRARVKRAARYLSPLTDIELAHAMWRRMTGFADEGLPRFERHEQGADIFLDVVSAAASDDEYLIRSIRRASALIIAEQAGKPALVDLNGIGEALFLAARIQAQEAVNPIYALALNPEGEARLSNGESLQARSLRALLGLLIAFPASAREAHRKLFESLMVKSECSLTCLTALIAIFHGDRDRLVAAVRKHEIRIMDDQLDAHLAIAQTNSRSD